MYSKNGAIASWAGSNSSCKVNCSFTIESFIDSDIGNFGTHLCEIRFTISEYAFTAIIQLETFVIDSHSRTMAIFSSS